MTPDNTCFGAIPGGLLDSLIDAETGRFDASSFDTTSSTEITQKFRSL